LLVDSFWMVVVRVFSFLHTQQKMRTSNTLFKKRVFLKPGCALTSTLFSVKLSESVSAIGCSTDKGARLRSSNIGTTGTTGPVRDDVLTSSGTTGPVRDVFLTSSSPVREDVFLISVSVAIDATKSADGGRTRAVRPAAGELIDEDDDEELIDKDDEEDDEEDDNDDDCRTGKVKGNDRLALVIFP
jgi:hypothetical protein